MKNKLTFERYLYFLNINLWNDKILVSFLFLLILFYTEFYIFRTGLVAFMGDSASYADRAKYIAQSFTLSCNGGSFKYPPFYSLLISPAFFFTNFSDTFFAIKLIHGFIYSLSVFPIYYYIRELKRFSKIDTVLLTIVLSIAPYCLPYSWMILSEVAFFPLCYSLVFLLSNYFFGQKNPLKLYLLISVLICSVLLRSAALSIFLSFLIWLPLKWFVKDSTRLKSWKFLFQKEVYDDLKPISVALLFYFCYGFIDSNFIDYRFGTSSYISLENLISDLLTREIFLKKISWFLNSFGYLILGGVSILILNSIFSIISKTNWKRQDLEVAFILINFLISAVLIAFIAHESYGTKELTWNKYIVPSVASLSLVSLNFFKEMQKGIQNRLVITFFFFLFILGQPSSMGFHFQDSLTLFSERYGNSNLFFFNNFSDSRIIEPLLQNGAYFLIIIVMTLLIRLKSIHLFSIFLILVYLFLNHGSFRYWKHAGIKKIEEYSGAGFTTFKRRGVIEKEILFLDTRIVSSDGFQFGLLEFFLPKEFSRINEGEIWDRKPEDSLLITKNQCIGCEVIDQDQYGVRVERLNSRMGEVSSYNRFGYREYIPISGKVTPVSWLGNNASIAIFVKKNLRLNVKFKVDTYGKAGFLRMSLNNQLVKEILVPGQPFRPLMNEQSLSILCLKGLNTLEFSSTAGEIDLGGGRMAALLLREDLQFEVLSQ